MNYGRTLKMMMWGFFVLAWFVSNASAAEIITVDDFEQRVVTEDQLIKMADNAIILFDSSVSMSELYKNTGKSRYDIAKDLLVKGNQNLPNLQMGGFSIGAKLGDYGISDAEYMPIVRVVPMYPRQAAMLGIEGYVIVSFTVTATGSVRDCVIVESSNAIFNRSAVQAALKFKYKPRLVDGVAVEVHGVQTKLSYAFEE